MKLRITLILFLVAGYCFLAGAAQYCPAPQFDTSKYQFHQQTMPPPRSVMWDWIDPAVLFITLCAASWLVHRKRNRRWISGLMLFSLVYFGFWRHGCVCPVGAIGNIALAAGNADYAVPLVVLAFFLLPLLFTLLFGRGFCGAVCPLGALQDLFIIKPVRVPRSLETGLRLFAYLYLAAAVVMAATGMPFIICQYDPFVTLFRFGGLPVGWLLLTVFLGLSVVIARPYCRFLCPYGVILRNISRLALWRVKITRDDCFGCRLCENACPFEAISKPSKELPALEFKKNKRRFLFVAGLTPVLAAGGGWLGQALFPVFADLAGLDDTVLSWGMSLTVTAGVILGIVTAAKLAQTVIFRQRDVYEIIQSDCMACGRCFSFCPAELRGRIR